MARAPASPRAPFIFQLFGSHQTLALAGKAIVALSRRGDDREETRARVERAQCLGRVARTNPRTCILVVACGHSLSADRFVSLALWHAAFELHSQALKCDFPEIHSQALTTRPQSLLDGCTHSSLSEAYRGIESSLSERPLQPGKRHALTRLFLSFCASFRFTHPLTNACPPFPCCAHPLFERLAICLRPRQPPKSTHSTHCLQLLVQNAHDYLHT